MKKPAPCVSPLAAVWKSMTWLSWYIRRVAALRKLDDERLTRIENRLAAQDGAADADAARREALAAINRNAVAEGRAPLQFRLDSRGKVEWTGDLREPPK